MTVTADPRNIDQQRDALAGRLFQTTLAALDLWAIYLGHHLRYYEMLAAGPMTSSELATKTGTHERYTREWLEQQAVTGILSLDDTDADVEARRYRLEPGAAEVLTDTDSLSYMIPLVRYFVAAGLLVPDLLDVYRAGSGIAWTRVPVAPSHSNTCSANTSRICAIAHSASAATGAAIPSKAQIAATSSARLSV